MKRLAKFGLLISAFRFFSVSAFPESLPSDCAIVATESAARLQATGCWTRILKIVFLGSDGHLVGHAVTVWQPVNTKRICIYDAALIHGTVELATESHDADEIAQAFARRWGIIITHSHFYE